MATGRMAGKVAFLTGGGAGIARATALAFAREGAKVALAELNREAGSSAEKEIREAGGEAVFVHADVTRDADVARAVSQTVEAFGRLDVLFNCAGGSSLNDAPVHEMDLEVWHRTIALNLLHPFLCCRHGIPHLIAAGGGSIINVGSHMGLVGTIRPAYAAAKGGLMSFTQTLAAQYADHGIRANVLAVGTVSSERNVARYANPEWQRANPAAAATRELSKKLYPFAFGTPADVAAIAVFLGSDESRMITGTTVAADGGRSSYLKIHAGG
ncbi:SDR family NAD(P)-dependent oxidoreductase [Pigmentiphaga soli]|uniref:SDR family NAD(P)-dependent oxidoreductase n=1 Tax=Pigmentiphaga soli TaxID=1007095 RepID=A0ABP8GWB7_9BURK